MDAGVSTDKWSPTDPSVKFHRWLCWRIALQELIRKMNKDEAFKKEPNSVEKVDLVVQNLASKKSVNRTELSQQDFLRDPLPGEIAIADLKCPNCPYVVKNRKLTYMSDLIDQYSREAFVNRN